MHTQNNYTCTSMHIYFGFQASSVWCKWMCTHLTPHTHTHTVSHNCFYYTFLAQRFSTRFRNKKKERGGYERINGRHKTRLRHHTHIDTTHQSGPWNLSNSGPKRRKKPRNGSRQKGTSTGLTQVTCDQHAVVSHNCFYCTSKPECAIPDDNQHGLIWVPGLTDLSAQYRLDIQLGLEYQVLIYEVTCLTWVSCVCVCVYILNIRSSWGTRFWFTKQHTYIHAYFRATYIHTCILIYILASLMNNIKNTPYIHTYICISKTSHVHVHKHAYIQKAHAWFWNCTLKMHITCLWVTTDVKSFIQTCACMRMFAYTPPSDHGCEQY